MAFRDFAFPKVQYDLGLTVHDADLFASAPPFTVREEFGAFIQEGVALAVANSTEKAKSEFIIAPVLLELRRALGRSFSLFSGLEWEVDARRITCPGIVELCEKTGDFQTLADVAREQNNAVHYVAGLLASRGR